MRHVHPLTDEEVQAVQQLHRSTKNSAIRSRCDMILLSHEGFSPPQIGQRVRCSGRTVRRFIVRYEREGLGGLSPRPRPGRPPRVTPEYLQLLEERVEQWPRDVGLPFSNWTTANLATDMAQQTGITLSARQLENYLKANDWRRRRPVRTVKHKQDIDLVTAKKTHV